MPNRLINEQSPYLLQHAHNPVDWFPWGDEAFELARQQDKPVLISIGYSACHWCHVMERESFEDEATAAFMNEHFVNIKVDREEHPDVDHMYMDAVQAITGSGGWPLNVFARHDRVPFYGGTYFPPKPLYGRASWMQVMARMHEIWTRQRDEVTNQTTQMLQYLQQVSKAATSKEQTEWTGKEILMVTDNLLKMADTSNGGFGQAPKFPGTMAIGYLLDYYHYTGYEPALKHAQNSLYAMLNGGIYDHIGGGLARYATDAGWLVPHFEKMLYDNALLVSVLCDAYAITKDEKYKTAIDEIIGFVNRELRDASGGYYSALDADSEGVEGKYYTWAWDEWKAVTGDDKIAEKYFGVSEQGNWEHTNILHEDVPLEVLAKESGKDLEHLKMHIAKLKKALFREREKRERPGTDDKCLLSWNALMNIALSRAGTVTSNENYVVQAAEHMDWMLNDYYKDGVWLHTWKDGAARIPAKLDDLAYLVQAMLTLAEASGNSGLIIRANDIQTFIESEFLNEEKSFYYYSGKSGQDIPVRKVDVYDGALPSANSVVAHNLVKLGLLMEKSGYTEHGFYLCRQMQGSVLRYPYSFGSWARLSLLMHAGFKTAVAAGAGVQKIVKELHKFYIPNCYIVVANSASGEIPLLAGKSEFSEPFVYVCDIESCRPPQRDVKAILQLIEHTT